MTKRFEGEQVLLRIFIGESDRCGDGTYRGMALHEAILRMLREEGFAGATVLRGMAGFGASAKIHTMDILRLSADLPVVIEAVDSNDRVEAVLPKLDGMIGGGLVTIERVHVILYRPA